MEIGYLSCSWSNWNAYIAGSAYYFKRSELHGFGGFGKVRVIYNDLISIEGFISGDRLFGTNISGTLGIRIPLGKREMKSVKNRHYCVHKSRPIERLEPIVLDKNRRKEVAKDASGVPLNFIFVNNLNGSNGTFEDPFATLLDAQNSSNPGDVVYVFPGDGTTKGMNAGITMQERQTLAGSGTALAVVTSRGNIIVPALTAQGPQITNAAGNGVDVARNCTVSGITVSGASSNGFSYLSNNGVSTINMLHCTSNNSGRQGFDFISGGSSQVSFAFDNCVSAGATRNGLRFISNDTSQMNLVSNHCTASNAGIDNFGIASNDASQMNLTFNHCDSIDGSGDGFFLDSDHESQINVVFNHCIVAGVSGDGFDAQSDDISQMNLTFNNCRSSTSAQEGFEIDSRASSKMTVIFNQCSSNGAAFDGFDVRSANTSRMSASLNNCIATNSGPSSGGFEFDAANTSLMTLKMSGCSATNNDDIGYRIGVFGSNITGSLTQCSSVENANANFSIATPIAGTFTITGNTTLSTEL